MMMPPRNWLAAVLGLRMRPQSNEPRKRLTRGSPVTALTRTSQNIAPWECIDQCIVSSGGGGARLDRDRLALRAAEDRRIALVPLGLVELAQAAIAAADLVRVQARPAASRCRRA